MDNILKHIHNAKDWQLNNTINDMRSLLNCNSLTQHVADTIMNECSLELQKRNNSN